MSGMNKFTIITGCNATHLKSLSNILNRNPKVFIYHRHKLLSMLRDVLNNKICFDSYGDLQRNGKPFLRSLVRDNTLLKKTVMHYVDNRMKDINEILYESFDKSIKYSTGRSIEKFDVVGCFEDNPLYLPQLVGKINNLKIIMMVSHPKSYIFNRTKRKMTKKTKIRKQTRLLARWDNILKFAKLSKAFIVKSEDFAFKKRETVSRITDYLGVMDVDVPNNEAFEETMPSLGKLEYKIRSTINKYPELDY